MQNKKNIEKEVERDTRFEGVKVNPQVIRSYVCMHGAVNQSFLCKFHIINILAYFFVFKFHFFFNSGIFVESTGELTQKRRRFFVAFLNLSKVEW